jgi:hypothetical protein
VREYLKMRMQGPEIIADIPLVKCCYEAMEGLYPDREASSLEWFRFESLWPPNCPDDKREIKQADANAIYLASNAQLAPQMLSKQAVQYEKEAHSRSSASERSHPPFTSSGEGSEADDNEDMELEADTVAVAVGAQLAQAEVVDVSESSVYLVPSGPSGPATATTHTATTPHVDAEGAGKDVEAHAQAKLQRLVIIPHAPVTDYTMSRWVKEPTPSTVTTHKDGHKEGDKTGAAPMSAMSGMSSWLSPSFRQQQTKQLKRDSVPPPTKQPKRMLLHEKNQPHSRSWRRQRRGWKTSHSQSCMPQRLSPTPDELSSLAG